MLGLLLDFFGDVLGKGGEDCDVCRVRDLDGGGLWWVERWVGFVCM